MPENRANTLYGWLAAEHARLHVVATWVDSPRKRAVMEAIRSSIRSLSQEDAGFTCALCRSERIVEIFPKGARLRSITNVRKAA